MKNFYFCMTIEYSSKNTQFELLVSTGELAFWSPDRSSRTSWHAQWLPCCKNTSGWRPWYQERVVLKFPGICPKTWFSRFALTSEIIRQIMTQIALCKGIQITETKLFACGIRNPELWNPAFSSGNPNTAKDWKMESKFHWKEVRDSELGIGNPQRGIQNPRLPWIALHGAIQILCRNKVIKFFESVNLKKAACTQAQAVL